MTNAALYFVDRHVFAGREDKIAFHEYPSGCVLTYGMLAAQSDKAGIATEERTAVLVLTIRSFYKKKGPQSRSPFVILNCWVYVQATRSGRNSNEMCISPPTRPSRVLLYSERQ